MNMTAGTTVSLLFLLWARCLNIHVTAAPAATLSSSSSVGSSHSWPQKGEARSTSHHVKRPNLRSLHEGTLESSFDEADPSPLYQESEHHQPEEPIDDIIDKEGFYWLERPVDSIEEASGSSSEGADSIAPSESDTEEERPPESSKQKEKENKSKSKIKSSKEDKEEAEKEENSKSKANSSRQKDDKEKEAQGPPDKSAPGKDPPGEEDIDSFEGDPGFQEGADEY